MPNSNVIRQFERRANQQVHRKGFGDYLDVTTRPITWLSDNLFGNLLSYFSSGLANLATLAFALIYTVLMAKGVIGVQATFLSNVILIGGLAVGIPIQVVAQLKAAIVWHQQDKQVREVRRILEIDNWRNLQFAKSSAFLFWLTAILRAPAILALIPGIVLMGIDIKNPTDALFIWGSGVGAIGLGVSSVLSFLESIYQEHQGAL